MGDIKDLGRTFMRDFVVDGVPASGVNEPSKSDGRAVFQTIDAEVDALKAAQQAGTVAYATRAELFAHLDPDEGAIGEVYNDPNDSPSDRRNGRYTKNGAAGSGSWTRVGDLTSEVVVQAVLDRVVPRDPVSGRASIDDVKGQFRLLDDADFAILRLDKTHGWIGIRGDAKAPFDSVGQAIVGGASAAARASLAAGLYEAIAAGLSDKVLMLFRENKGKAGVEIRGTSNVSADRRLAIVDSDNAGSELITLMLTGSRRIGIGTSNPQDAFHLQGRLRLTDDTVPGSLAVLKYDASAGIRAPEMVIGTSLSGLNVAVVQNDAPDGYSAIVARGADGVEHLAIGYGNPAASGIFAGKSYLEASHFTGSNHTTPPPEWVFVQTGYLNGGYGNYTRMRWESDGDFKLLSVGGFEDFRYVNSRFGVRRDPECDFDIWGQAAVGTSNNSRATDLAGGFAFNIFGSDEKTLRLLRPSVVKADIKVQGASNVSADRRLEFVDTDNSGVVALALALNGTGQATVGGPLKLRTYTVATLPSASTAGAGATAHVSDASSPSFGATVVGGGSTRAPVYSDSTNWKVG